MKFLNRIKQRDLLKQRFNNIKNSIEQCIWIEGKSGTGKTYFVKYMKKQEEPPIFYFDDYNWLYKCNLNDIDREFMYIIAIISNFQTKYPKEFNDYLINYFNDKNSMNWKEALIHLIPNIKYTEWAKDIVASNVKEALDAKSDISSRMYLHNLPSFFADLILYMLTYIENKNSIVFCIDDACWLDSNSIKTINVILNRLPSFEDLKISFVVITRREKDIEQEKSNYKLLESVLKDHYHELDYIYIKNFDIETTQKYMELMNKTIVLEKSTIIYKITNGNPQELYQALKIDNEDLLELCERQYKDNFNQLMSNELVFSLMQKNIYTLPILACVALLHITVSTSWLPLLVRFICDRLHISFISANCDECIVLLEQNDLISTKKDKIIITHDSIKEIIIDFLKDNGEYIVYLDAITTFLETYKEQKEIVKEIFCLYSYYNTEKCFNFFITNYTSKYFLDTDMYVIVGKSLLQNFSLFTANNLNEFIVPIILQECSFLSLHSTVYSICSLIYPIRNKLSRKTKFQYLILFAKTLIDIAYLNAEQKYDAINIINEILQIENLNINEKMETHLLAMSAYEHILDFNNIKLNNDIATSLCQESSVSYYLKAMYWRNQGLVQSHIELEESYKAAIVYAEKIDNLKQRDLMLGTCHNNLGLSYLYSGDVTKALYYFNEAKIYLENIGYDAFRVLNNISVCYLLKGNLQDAYTNLLRAKAFNIDCVFEKLCIQSNLAIIEWKLGQKDSAKQIALKIYDEYKNKKKQTTDELVYSSIMANLGYFYFCEGEYIDAAKMYKESEFFKYRYNNEEQLYKRQSMVKICWSKLMEVPLQEGIDLDLNENKQDIFRCMYAPISFAYYII